VVDYIVGLLDTKLIGSEIRLPKMKIKSVIPCTKKVGNLWRPFNENYEPL